MRQLVVVAVSADGTRLLLGPRLDARPSHEVALDDRLVRAVRGQPLDDAAPAAASALTPKEIQARLRAGASVEEVAKEAGVARGRVERYAGPVLSERENVLDAIRSATLMRPRGGPSRRRLGDAVTANLATTAFARPETAAWSAYRRPDGAWVARLDVVVRGRQRRAEWVLDPETGRALALGPYAAALGFAPEPAAVRSDAPPGDKVSAKKVSTNKVSAKKVPTNKVPAKKVPATKPARASKAAGKVPAKTPTKTTREPAIGAAAKAASKPPARRGRGRS